MNIFLDVDEVLKQLNKLIWLYNKKHKPYSVIKEFNEKCLENLKILVEHTF